VPDSVTAPGEFCFLVTPFLSSAQSLIFPLLSNGKFRKPGRVHPLSPFGQPGLTTTKSGTYIASSAPKLVKVIFSNENHHFPFLRNGRFPQLGVY
jgi:hypothetical protein